MSHRRGCGGGGRSGSREECRDRLCLVLTMLRRSFISTIQSYTHHLLGRAGQSDTQGHYDVQSAGLAWLHLLVVHAE